MQASSDHLALRLEASGYLAEVFQSLAQEGCSASMLALGTGSEMTELSWSPAPFLYGFKNVYC